MLENGSLFSPPVADHMRSFLNLQREVVGVWHQSLASWCSRRADGVNAALELGTALAAARTPAAAVSVWMDCYTGAVGRWSEDVQEQVRLGLMTVEKPVAPVRTIGADAPPNTGAGPDPVVRDSRPVMDLPVQGEWAMRPERSQAA